jgi:hypothetical protein
MTDPPPRASRCGMPILQHRNTDLRLTSWTRCHASSDVSRTEASSFGEIPALLKRMSMPPNRATVSSYMRVTSASLVTSAWTYMPPISPVVCSPASSARSTTHTSAPSSANRTAVSRPMPLAPPVMTATLPARRAAMGSPLRRDEHGLDLGVVLQRVGSELAPTPDCLKPPNGVCTRTELLELTDRLPDSTPRATRSARPESRVQIEPERP